MPMIQNVNDNPLCGTGELFIKCVSIFSAGSQNLVEVFCKDAFDNYCTVLRFQIIGGYVM